MAGKIQVLILIGPLQPPGLASWSKGRLIQADPAKTEGKPGIDFRSPLAQDGRAANLDSVPFDADHPSVLCTWECEVPLAHLLPCSMSIHSNSCPYDLTFIEHLLYARHHTKVLGICIISQNPLEGMDYRKVICQGYKWQN